MCYVSFDVAQWDSLLSAWCEAAKGAHQMVVENQVGVHWILLDIILLLKSGMDGG